MRPIRLFIALVVLLSGLTVASTAQAAAPTGFSDTQIAGVGSPTGLAFTPDGRLLVTSQGGQIRVIKNGTLLATAALSLAVCTESERGLLGIATDPNPANKFVYVYYTRRVGTGTGGCPAASGTPNTPQAPRNRVSRFTLGDNDVIDPASEVPLLDGIYSTAGNHNGGDLHVGKDGYLYVTVGDGGCDYNGDASHPGGSGCGGANDDSRDRNILNGKVLRITTTGGIPADNPFTGAGTARCQFAPAAPGQICQETYAWGLRNPFRFAFDPNAAGTSFRINDVGQNVWEEIDQATKGADYGWNVREGHCQQTGSETDCGGAKPAGMTDPIYDYSHSTAVDGVKCGSITGGAYVPNGVWPASFTGSYLFSDYVCGAIFSLSPGNVRSTVLSGLGVSSAVAMTFGPDGSTQSLYYTDYAGGGEVRRLRYTGTADRPPVAALTARPGVGAVPLTSTLDATGSTDADGDTLTYRWNFGDGTSCTSGCAAKLTHSYTKAGTFTATVTVTDPGGLSSTASTVVRPGDTPPSVTITSPTASQLFTVGGQYTLHGTATDAQDGPLPALALSWTVIKHHATHTHPFLGPVAGNDVPITGPSPEDLAAAGNSYLEIRLTATDSAGASTTLTQNFNPAKVPVTLATSPTGRQVTVNASPVTGPTTVTSWRGWPLQLAVPAQADSSGVVFVFGQWSDGGAASHDYTTPAGASTVTATLIPSPAAPNTVVVRQSGPTSATISWSRPTTVGGSSLTGYRVSRDGTDSAGDGPFTTTVSNSTTTFTMTRLVPGRTYTLGVAASNSAATGPMASAPVTVLGAGLATAPVGVTVRSSSSGTARISWAAPAGAGGHAVTGYRVSRDGVDDQGVGAYTASVPAATATFTMTALVPGRTYTLTIQAVTSAGFGATAAGAAVVSGSSRLGAPAGVSVATNASGAAGLSWAPPVYAGGQTITGYRVLRDGTDNAGAGAVNTVLPASARSYTSTRLASGQAYALSVQAVAGSGSGPIARDTVRIP